MFGFFSKSRYLADILEGFYDVHSHLLPGVDDGSNAPETTTELLRQMENMGVRGVYMTPHIINGVYDNRSEDDMRKVFAEFKYDGNVELRLSAEYFIDDRFGEHMSGKPLAMKGNYILSEFQLNSYSINSFDLLFEATMAGYEVIIAHPERYSFLLGDKKNKVLELLSNSGYSTQLNLLSLTGYHGRFARKFAEEFLDNGFYDFVGTDIHSAHYLNAMQENKISSKLFGKLERLRENNLKLFKD